MATDSDTFRARRASLLEEGNRLEAGYRAAGGASEGRAPESDAAIFRVFDLHDQYEQLLPEIVLARCPFTGTEVTWPIDLVDLDGWFWNYDNPTRRLRNPVVPTWLAMGGAVRLSEPIAAAPFDCMPGPDCPYVVPRILEREDTAAVIAQLPLGPHTAWAITYFTTRRPRDVALENLWGTRRYDTYDDSGHWRGWAEYGQNAGDYDFDLAPWLDSGKLRWIAPGDAEATLRGGSADCPFVGLEGTRQLQLIRSARVSRF